MHSLYYDKYELDLNICAVLEMKLFRVPNGLKLYFIRKHSYHFLHLISVAN